MSLTPSELQSTAVPTGTVSEPPAAALAEGDQLVRPVHVAIRGRARLRVRGLQRNDQLKQALEYKLPSMDGVSTASANVLTGTILLTFDPARSTTDIMIVVAHALHSADGSARDTGRAVRAGRMKEAARAATETKAASGSTADWYALDASDVLSRFGTSSRTGLDSDRARESEALHGRNVIPPAEPRSSLEILAGQFDSFPVVLLGGCAALSIMTGGLGNAAAILGIVAMNAAIGYFCESSSERSIHALSQLATPQATVIRDGNVRPIPTEAIVPGDLVVLERGDLVPADGRIVKARDLMVDESALTGESAPVLKRARALNGGAVPLSGRVNMVYKGTSVVGGSGLAVVVGTGRDTEMGEIQALVGTARPPETPLQRQLDRLGVRLVFASLAAAGVVFAIGTLRGMGIIPMLQSAMSLALAALPEGFPAISTATLALSIREMRQRKVVIRHLDAVETLGSVGVICLDKTGTLTANRMEVVLVRTGSTDYALVNGSFSSADHADGAADRADLARTLEIAALCNQAEAGFSESPDVPGGSPTETALVRAAAIAGIDVTDLRQRHPLIETRQRSQARRFMVTRHENAQGSLLAIKGNPTDVLARCASYRERGVVRPLDDVRRARITATNERMAERALRVLGVAFRDANGGAPDRDWVWLGMVGIVDPIRPGMRELMHVFRRAHIQTVVITGDQTATARAVARELDLANGGPIELLDELDLARRQPQELAELAQRLHVFARVTPGSKLQIVQTFQRAGKVVAMTGDGINDSPALRAADIGIAIERGTSAAREAADIMLEDDDLRSLAAAVRQGRTVHRNIRKALRYLLATNTSEVLFMLGAIAAGSGPPLSPAQLLWINLLTDSLPAVALGLEPSAPDALDAPPFDPDAPLLARKDVPALAGQAAIISAGAFGALLYGLGRYGTGPEAGGLAFNALVGAQLLHAFSARSESTSMFRGEAMPRNPYLGGAIAATAGLQAGAWLFPPTRRLLGFPSIGILDALVVGAAAILPYLVNEAFKPTSRAEAPRSDQSVPADDIAQELIR